MIAIEPTKHALYRMNQRGIKQDDLLLAMRFGTDLDDGVVVLERDFKDFERAVKRELKNAERLVGKRFVIMNGRLITAYHMNDREKDRILKRAKEGNLL